MGVLDVVAVVVDHVGGQDDQPADRPVAVFGRDIDRRVADGKRRRGDWCDRRQRDRQQDSRPGGCESIGSR
jgi:hypothetical protein